MYKLSDRSLSKLEGVHPELVDVVKLAITLTKVDFGVTLETDLLWRALQRVRLVILKCRLILVLTSICDISLF